MSRVALSMFLAFLFTLLPTTVIAGGVCGHHRPRPSLAAR
jgi:hypothetical protein